MVFDLIVKMAWETGDPGLWFIDKTNKWRANPLPDLMKIEATNPCGEQPLFPFDVCNLGSISLIRFLIKENDKYDIDWTALEKAVRLGVHFLDNVIDLNPYPLPQIMELAHKIRRIGLGVMGWADMLIYLNIPYASKEACKMAEEAMEFINKTGHDESEKLAEERGPFPLWEKSIYKDGKPLRNCTITTIAPTGELSILAGCSGGIEPHYGLTKTHRYEGRVLAIYSPAFNRFVEVAKERGFYSPSLEEEVKNRGRIGDLDGVPDDIKRVFATAHEIPFEWHVRTQAAFQKNVDNGVSKTINLPNSATLADIEKAFWLAYETECLGVTVFRDGCKGGVLSVGIGIGEKPGTKTSRDFVRSRPNVLGTTIKVETPDGGAFVTINWDGDVGPKEAFEIFVTVAKAGTDAAADAEAIGRLASEILREDSSLSPIEKLVRIKTHLSGIGGSRVAGFGKDKVTSLGDGISKAIDAYLKRFGFIEAEITAEKKIDLDPVANEPENNNVVLIRGNYCPQCHKGTLVHEEGCTKCTNCPYTTC
jgi:ribonucleoside-diphosphate reductase alpha chain